MHWTMHLQTMSFYNPDGIPAEHRPVVFTQALDAVTFPGQQPDVTTGGAYRAKAQITFKSLLNMY
jgi:hypothetical protein